MPILFYERSNRTGIDLSESWLTVWKPPFWLATTASENRMCLHINAAWPVTLIAWGFLLTIFWIALLLWLPLIFFQML